MLFLIFPAIRGDDCTRQVHHPLNKVARSVESGVRLIWLIIQINHMTHHRSTSSLCRTLTHRDWAILAAYFFLSSFKFYSPHIGDRTLKAKLWQDVLNDSNFLIPSVTVVSTSSHFSLLLSVLILLALSSISCLCIFSPTSWVYRMTYPKLEHDIYNEYSPVGLVTI